MWILGSFQKDLLCLYIPALVSVSLAVIYPELGETSLIYGLVAMAVVDSGHVYTTIWRTYLHEKKIPRTILYNFTPFLFFIFFGLWYQFRIPGLWAFVTYATFFHHIRQSYGISKWYQVLNSRSDKTSDYFLYVLSVLPFLAYHFRSGNPEGYYSVSYVIVKPNETIFRNLSLAWCVFLFSYSLFEIKRWHEGKRELNRVCSVTIPTLCYGYCFFFGKNLSQILFPLLMLHGCSYMAILIHSLNRTQKERFKTPLVALLIVALTAMVFGLTESWIEDELLFSDLPYPRWLRSLLVGLTLSPLYCHYLFDAFIWKRSHFEASLIYSRSKPVNEQ